jgi:SAM-dependent methyltransferase
MGRHSLHKKHVPRILSAKGPYANAYFAEGAAKPLVDIHDARLPERTNKSQNRVCKLHDAFSRLFQKAGHNNETGYDLNRDPVYDAQTIRLRADFQSYFAACLSVLDIGCGTGQLARRIIRTHTIMDAIEAGRKMGMLGIDFNASALHAAVDKRNVLLSHHEPLRPNLQMDYVLLDLKDLGHLNLSQTCIGDKKADIVLASDIFRWLPESERFGVLEGIVEKMTRGGRFISMEFACPPLVVDHYMSRRLAAEFAEFGFSEPFGLGSFYEQAQKAGLQMVPDSKITAYEPEHDAFPPMAYCVFRLP